MEPEKAKRRMRLISGPAAIVDAQVNELLDEYLLAALNYNAVGGEIHVTAYLILQVEVRKMQLANPMMAVPGKH